MMSQFLSKVHNAQCFFPQDFRDFESSYRWNGNRYQQAAKKLFFGFWRSFILANKKLSKISIHIHFKQQFLGTSPLLPFIGVQKPKMRVSLLKVIIDKPFSAPYSKSVCIH